LVIGYDHEGKIDASPQACLAHVKEITAWDKAMTDKGAKDVCAARKRHVEAYAALQANYKSFVKAFFRRPAPRPPERGVQPQGPDQGLHRPQVRADDWWPQYQDRHHRERDRRGVPRPRQ